GAAPCPTHPPRLQHLRTCHLLPAPRGSPMKSPSRFAFVLLVLLAAPEVRGDDEALKRFTPAHLGKLVGISDPQISPDGKSIVVRVSRPNYDKNRSDAELVLVDVGSGRQRVLTYERPTVSHARWSPSGDRLAFLAA